MSQIRDKISLLPAGLRVYIEDILARAGNDLEKVQKELEKWFDAMMNQLSGWYRRRVKWFVLGFAFAVTLALNVDSVLIVGTLWKDPAVRASVVARVESVTATPIPCPTPTATPASENDPLNLDCVRQRVEAVKGLGVPIGWPNLNWRSWATVDRLDPRVPHSAAEGWLKILGWAITVAAIMRGAPFWFDLLNKAGSLRSRADPPDRSP